MTDKKILLITVDQVIQFNKEIVAKEKQRHQVLDRGKIESAINAAFYPGDYPFQYRNGSLTFNAKIALNSGMTRESDGIFKLKNKSHA